MYGLVTTRSSPVSSLLFLETISFRCFASNTGKARKEKKKFHLARKKSKKIPNQSYASGYKNLVQSNLAAVNEDIRQKIGRKINPKGIHRLEKKTTQLLNRSRNPVGSLSPVLCRELVVCMEYWIQNRIKNCTSDDDIFYAANRTDYLFHRLIEECQKSDESFQRLIKETDESTLSKKYIHDKAKVAMLVDSKIMAHVHSLAIDGWRRVCALSKKPDATTTALEHAETIFESMKKRDLHNTPSFNHMIDLYSKLRNPCKANELLNIMILSMAANGNKKSNIVPLFPTTFNVNCVIGAYSSIGDARSAYSLLARMEKEQLHHGSNNTAINIEPNIISYTSVITAFCQNSFDLNERGVVDRLVGKILESRETLNPDTKFYNVAINYFLKCALSLEKGDKDAVRLAKRSEYLLHKMHNVYESSQNILTSSDVAIAGSPDHFNHAASSCVKPDTTTYNSVMKCWSKCGSIKKVKALFNRMAELQHDGDRNIGPNAMSYCIVMDTIVKNMVERSLSKYIQFFLTSRHILFLP